MQAEAKRILGELTTLSNNGIHINRELVMMLTNKNSYWYVVFSNTKNFNECMNELYNEAM